MLFCYSSPGRLRQSSHSVPTKSQCSADNTRSLNNIRILLNLLSLKDKKLPWITILRIYVLTGSFPCFHSTDNYALTALPSCSKTSLSEAIQLGSHIGIVCSNLWLFCWLFYFNISMWIYLKSLCTVMCSLYPVHEKLPFTIILG